MISPVSSILGLWICALGKFEQTSSTPIISRYIRLNNFVYVVSGQYSLPLATYLTCVGPLEYANV